MARPRAWRAALGAGVLLILAVAWLAGGSPPAQPPQRDPAPAVAASVPAQPVNPGLTDLAVRGQLRVLRIDCDSGRDTPVTAANRRLLADFAREHHLQLVEVPVATPTEIVRQLLARHADLTTADLPLEFDTDPRLARTASLHSTRFVAIARTGEIRQRSPAALLGRRVAVDAHSPIWTVLARLAAAYPQISLLPQLERVDARTLMAGLVENRWDFAVGPAEEFETALRGSSKVAVAFALSQDRPVGWTISAAAPDLRASLDDFLHRSPIVGFDTERYDDDLDGIRKRGTLRVVTRIAGDAYFLDNGRPAGFEYDLVSQFARRQGLRLKVIVVDTPAQMVAALRSGRGDIALGRVGASLADAQADLAVSAPYHFIAPILVGRADGPSPDRFEELRGKVLVVNRNLTDVDRLSDVAAAGVSLRVKSEAPEATLDAVARGRYAGTVVDAHLVTALTAGRADLRVGATVEASHPFRWSMRGGDRNLRAAVDAYLADARTSGEMRWLSRLYFDRPVRVAKVRQPTVTISPYDALARRYGHEYGLDWRLITALMFEESRFNPRAVSNAGAVGLTQMLPATARELGFTNVRDPTASVHAAAVYLDQLRNRFPGELPLAERTWFVLGAYHGGYDLIRRARVRAQRMGLDPNRWFGHVERALMTLNGNDLIPARRTVAYVRAVRGWYEAYLQFTTPVQVAGVPASHDSDA
ncbi:MAG: transporter substrate-binding domain-containing protein [Gammaproteobacteria bacterium]